MDAFQLAAAKQSLVDIRLRKQRSPSFATHVSAVVASANTRLVASAEKSTRATPTSTSKSSPDVPASHVLASIVDRYDNFSSMAYTKSPPARSFGPVSPAESFVAGVNNIIAIPAEAVDNSTNKSSASASTSASASASVSKSASASTATSAYTPPTSTTPSSILEPSDYYVPMSYTDTNPTPAEYLSQACPIEERYRAGAVEVSNIFGLTPGELVLRSTVKSESADVELMPTVEYGSNANNNAYVALRRRRAARAAQRT